MPDIDPVNIIPQHSWICQNPEQFLFDASNYQIEILGKFGYYRQTYKPNSNELINSLTDYRKVRVKQKNSESGNFVTVFERELPGLLSASLGYCGENVYLLCNDCKLYDFEFYQEFYGEIGQFFDTAKIYWRLPYAIPIEFVKASITNEIPYSFGWAVNTQLPSLFAGLNLELFGTYTATDQIWSVADPSGTFSQFSNNYNLDRQQTINNYEIIYNYKGFAALKLAFIPINNSDIVNERIIEPGINADSFEYYFYIRILSEIQQSSYAQPVSSSISQKAFLLPSEPVRVCDIQIQQNSIYRQEGYFCMAQEEYDTLIARFSGIQQTLRRRR